MTKETQAAPFSFDDPPEVGAVAGELAAQMPDPQEHAMAEHRAQEQAAADSAEKDAAGVPFNPEIHTGSKLKSGLWRMRKGKAAPGSSRSRVALPTGSAENSVDDAAAKAAANSMAAGAAAAGCFFMFARGVMGEEWEPDESEVQMHSNAWGVYFQSKEITDFPPGVAVLVAIGSFAATRLHKPKTKARLQGFKNWLITRAAVWKMKRELKKRGVTATVEVVDGKIRVTEKSA